MMKLLKKVMSNNRGSGFFKGVLFGAVLGAVAGILLAPDEGKNTRRKLKNKKEEIEPRLRELASIISNNVVPFFEGLAESSQKGIREVKEVASEVRKDVVEVVEEGVRQAKSSINTSPSPPSPPAQKPPKRKFFRVDR